MPKKVTQKSSPAKKARPSALEARLARLESRFTDWGPQLDAQFAEVKRRLETLERRIAALEGTSEPEPPKPPESGAYL